MAGARSGRGAARRAGPTDGEMLAPWRVGAETRLDAVAPGEAWSDGVRTCWCVRRRGADVDAVAPEVARRLARLAGWPPDVHAEVSRADRSRIVPDAFDSSRVLFLDIETAGLSPSTYLFLVGMMWQMGEDFVLEQALARDYAEEAGVLARVAEVMARFDAVVTYNGDSFDLPFVRTRMAVHRIVPAREPASVDLLHAARRVLRGVLPNCRLVTVERHLRGRGRDDDLPSRLVPVAWHDFVRTGDARVIAGVLEHNRLDVITMAQLLARLSEGVG